MTFTRGNLIEVPLKNHAGTLEYAESWDTDGLSNIWMNFALHNLDSSVVDGRVTVFDGNNLQLQQFAAGLPPNQYGNIPLHVVINASQLPDAASTAYGEWKANIALRTAAGWEFDGTYRFIVTFTGAPPPPPPPPPPPDPCANCGPGTHCENGTCVPNPPPPPEPGWLEKLKALFPAQLQQYAVPITIGVGILAYQGFKKK